MLKAEADRLTPRFHLSYNMLLNFTLSPPLTIFTVPIIMRFSSDPGRKVRHLNFSKSRSKRANPVELSWG